MTTQNNTIAATTAQEKPTKYFIKFNSVEDANNWLGMQNSIVVTNIAASTKSVFSFPANSIAVTEIRMEYIRYAHPTNYHYGISQHDFTRLYCSAKIEKLRDKWKSCNPDKQCIQCLKSTNRRFLAGSHFGFIAFVKDKLLVLYR